MRTFRTNLLVTRVMLTFVFLGLFPVMWETAAFSEQDPKYLKYKKVDKETILVTDGISYKKDVIVKENCTIFIEDVPFAKGAFLAGKGSILPSVSGKFPGAILTFKLEKPSMFFHSFAKGSDTEDLKDAVNVTWIFGKPNMSFEIDGFTFTSTKEGSELKFTKEGVLLKGFEVKVK